MRGGAIDGYCGGRGWIFTADLKTAFFGMRSPAWRARSEAEGEFRRWYDSVWRQETPSPVLASYQLRAPILVDDTHAMVPMVENGAQTPTEWRWVWATEPTFPKGTWYLFSDGIDDWP